MPHLESPTTLRPMADQIHNPEEILANFEELSILESEFEDVEIELSTPYPYFFPLYLNC
jgi:hypothetical protein